MCAPQSFVNQFYIYVSSPQACILHSTDSFNTKQTPKISVVSQAMASLTTSTSTPIALLKPFELQKSQPVKVPCLSYSWKPSTCQLRSNRRMRVRPVEAAPDKLEDKLAESIKQAEDTCSGDPVSGECVAAWDEVEELSAAASHAREKKKGDDPLENFCKDNPETEECRTYDN